MKIASALLLQFGIIGWFVAALMSLVAHGPHGNWREDVALCLLASILYELRHGKEGL